MRPALTALAAALAALSAAPEAPAFCQARSCNPSDPAQRCQVDGRRCVVSGHALAWPSNCLQIGIHEGGSARHGIGLEQLRDVTAAAFQVWTGADCSPGNPSLSVEILVPIACGESEYNSGAGNVNLVVFRDDAWPYAGAVDTLGRTLIHFNADTGEIWDADIEINGTEGPISVDGSGTIDLQSLLTHEAGHVLGLDHSDVAGATMIAGYRAEDTSLRTLDPDDVAGICAMFPPGAEISGSCDPRGGFSDQCGGYIEPEPTPPPPPSDDGGCGMASRTPHGGAAFVAGALAIAFSAARRKLRQRRITEPS